jgi:uncharacterized protein
MIVQRNRLFMLFARVKPTSWWIVTLFAVAHTALLLLFYTRGFVRHVTLPVYQATNGLMSHTLLTNLLEVVLLVGIVMMLMGGLRLRDLGLTRHALINAALIMAAFWGVLQLVLAGAAAIAIGAPEPNPALMEVPVERAVSLPIEAVMGAALAEEIAYRGFLTPQVFLLTAAWFWDRPKLRLGLAIVLPQLFFGLNHIPAGIYSGMDLTALSLYILQVFLVGCFFAAIYLRTANLFVAIGVHGMLNYPNAIFASAVDPALIVLILACILLLVWPRLNEWLDEVFTMRPALMPTRRTPPSEQVALGER